MKKIVIGVLIATLTGCVAINNVTMMPRDPGSNYSGELQGNGSGSGLMSIMLGDARCKGPAAIVASNESFGLVSTFGSDSRGTVGNALGAVSTSGNSTVKTILTCSNGKGPGAALEEGMPQAVASVLITPAACLMS